MSGNGREGPVAARPDAARPDAARPIARWVTAAAVLLLGTVAALRLPLAYQPSWSFPELYVDLNLPENNDVEALTRTWILPLESAIRSAGEVRGLAGEVSARGGGFRVRFRAGTDAERKAARLESELGALRRQLPPESSLSITPAGQSSGDISLIAWLPSSPGQEVDRRLIERIRDLPSVRSVYLAGEQPREIRVAQRDLSGDPASLHAGLQAELASVDLGWTTFAGKQVPVRVRGAGDVPFLEQRLRRGRAVVPLASLATLEITAEEARRLAHFDGRRGSVLLVERELDASPLALSRALRRELDHFGLGDRARIVIDEAIPLRQLLVRSLWGLAAASLVLLAAGFLLVGRPNALSYGAALPVAAAAAFNGLWLANLGLDVTTLPALAVGLACGLSFLALRHGGLARSAAVTTVVAGFAVPVAIALASGRLAPLLAAPAKVFAVTLATSVLALWVLPLRPAAALPPERIRRPLKAVLRHPGTVGLVVVTASYLLIVLSGHALSPRPGRLSPALADLAVVLRFPPATTLRQAEAQVSSIESHLGGLEEIEEHWSVFTRRAGSIGVRLQARHKRLDRLRSLVRRLEAELSILGAAARVVPLAAGSRRNDEPIRFSSEIEDRPETDEEAMTYRFLLRSTDLEALRRARSRVLDRLAPLNYSKRTDFIRTDWLEPTRQVELVPRPGVSSAAIRRAQNAFRQAAFPASQPLSADRDLRLRVTGPRAPQNEDDVPQRHDLLGLLAADRRPLAAPALFSVREIEGSPSLRRQSGRFVLPMSVQVPGFSTQYRRIVRAQIHHQLYEMPLPPGVALERPETNPFYWSRERLRMLAVAAALPLLMLAVAVCRLNSIAVSLAAATPVAAGLLAATPWILAAKGHVDEMTLLGLAMALAGSLPVVLAIAAAVKDRGASSLADGFAYRWLARRAPMVAAVSLAALTLLAVPGWGLDSDRVPWVLPQQAAAVTSAAIWLGGFSLLPALLLAGPRLWRRDPVQRRLEERPPSWRSDSALRLSVRNLVKIYGNGFVALRGVHFELGPGIIGLLGPNGAGKTTLLRLLCGLLEPTRGQVLFHGTPITSDNLPEYRRLVGFLPQGFNAYEGFTAEQFLDYWALEKGIRDRRRRQREIAELLEQVGLEEAAGRKVRDLSGGMRRRIGIARALLGDPRIVIVDEPTTGLDVESRNRLRESLLAAAGERIILFSTHIASDIAAAAGRILVLDRGRLLYDGAASGLIELARGRVFETLIADHELRDLSARYRLTTRVRTVQGIRVRAVTWGGQEPAGAQVEPNLEEAYLAVIGEPKERREGTRRQGSLLDLDVWRS